MHQFILGGQRVTPLQSLSETFPSEPLSIWVMPGNTLSPRRLCTRAPFVLMTWAVTQISYVCQRVRKYWCRGTPHSPQPFSAIHSAFGLLSWRVPWPHRVRELPTPAPTSPSSLSWSSVSSMYGQMQCSSGLERHARKTFTCDKDPDSFPTGAPEPLF